MPKALVDGYIWLGNLDLKTNNISSATIRNTDGSLVTDLGQLKAKVSLIAINPLYIRAMLPNNDARYFRDIPIVGVLEISQTVTLLNEPTQINRSSSLVQLWGHVQRTTSAKS